MTDTNTYQAQADELSQKLWAIANDLRGQMDASEFKNYILGVIFYRYLSERTEMYMTDLLKNDDGITYEEAFADDEYRPVVEEWSLAGVLAEENSTGVMYLHHILKRVLRHDLEVLRCDGIYGVDRFLMRIGDKDVAEVVQ